MDYQEIRKSVLKNSFITNACHLGGSLSCIKILCDLFDIIKEDDVFIFGKASGVATYYAILSELGYFPENKVAYYLKKYPLVSKEVPGVIWSGGSCGHGLSVAVGMALADRSRDVYVLLSDGECQEGSVYEACLFAGQHELDNLHVIVDHNGIQACDRVCDVLDLKTAFDFMENTLPNCEILRTVKGDSVDFMENKISSHYHNLTEKELEKALK